jgi:hypothetical protein
VDVFLTSALVRNEWSASLPGRFTPGEEPTVHVGVEAGYDLEERSSYDFRDSNPYLSSEPYPFAIPTALVNNLKYWVIYVIRKFNGVL